MIWNIRKSTGEKAAAASRKLSQWKTKASRLCTEVGGFGM